MAVRFGVRGAPELAAAFRALGRSPTVTSRRRARQAAGKVISQAAQANLVANDFRRDRRPGPIHGRGRGR